VRVQTTPGDIPGPRMMPTTAASTQPRAESQIAGKKSSVHSRRSKPPATLTEDDGLSVIAAALDSPTHIGRQNDCSHLVHAIYDRAGFSYPYSSSSDLYEGTDEFRRVKHPQPGDLVVWSGHVGIVVNPAQHAFFSTLTHGPGIDTYDAKYWQGRGPVRFYRYIKRQRRAHGPSPE
jgi:cell wall-associated NlpC family hydrolase